jgi:hypothetical protein
LMKPCRNRRSRVEERVIGGVPSLEDENISCR